MAESQDKSFMNKETPDVKSLISPNYTEAKLIPPFYRDLVDVFEDRMRHWMLYPAQRLLNEMHGQIAAVGILINYFEGIEIYLTGKDSKGKSSLFFGNGYKKVFKMQSESEEAADACAKALYDQARCGFAHDGLFRRRVCFTNSSQHTILVTWPKTNGQLVFSGGVESIVINPTKFYQEISHHFESYVEDLKRGEDDALITAFKSAVDLKWGLGEGHLTIGMSRQEFINS